MELLFMIGLTKPVQNIYDSAKNKNPAIEEFRALIRYRDLLVQLVRRDIVTRYKRSVLGILWTMLNPLGTMIILSIVFSQMFGTQESYPAFVITNLIAWNFFAQSTQFSLNATLWGSSLFQRIYLPRTAFVVSTAGTGVVNLVLALVPLTLVFLFTGVMIHISALLLPFALLLLAIFALGISLLLSTLVVFFPDVNEFYPVVLTAWMYLTPIMYPESLLANNRFGYWIMSLNPLYRELKLFRMVLFDGVIPDVHEWLIGIIVALVTLTLGWYFFTSKSKSFGYYL
jgi:ABC-type polysaccharide/polyol phosphate export permease